MKYNLLIKTKIKTYNILDIDEVELTYVIDAYKYGKASFFLSGKKYWFIRLSEIQVFTFEHAEINTKDDLVYFVNNKHLYTNNYLIPI